MKKSHKYPKIEDFNIFGKVIERTLSSESLLIKDFIGKSYRKNTFIWIFVDKRYKTLNTHEKSVPLKLFNWYNAFSVPLTCE